MKRIIRFTLIALVLTLLVGAVAALPTDTASADAKSRVLIEFAPGGKAAVQGALRAAGADTHFEFDNLNTIAASVPTQALNGLSRNPNVLAIEEDAIRELYGSGFNVGAAMSAVAMAGSGEVVPYGVDAVQARDIWDVNRDGVVDTGAVTGTGRTVCIIDTGFYAGHEDKGNAIGGYSQISGEIWSEDGNGHGTHVAGTIAAADNNLGVIGVAPGVSLYIVKIFNNDGVWTSTSNLIDATNRCVSGGAKVISMSLGGSTKSRTEENAFKNHYTNGILSVAAAGNDGSTRLSYPASYASVISVAAIDQNNVVANFSQKNSAVELAAPGVGVLSTVPYLSLNTITVDGVTYSGSQIEGGALGSATGGLVSGGLCTISNVAWSGKVVLCERGEISFADKVNNVKNSGGVAAVIYNNVPGGFLGTMGDGVTTTIVAISLSQEDGQFLVAYKLGLSATVQSSFTQPASGYEYYDGTSMATPHVSAVAALVWSANPTWTNDQIRNAMNATALDLGAAGRDNSYGYGLVQAYAALVYLGGANPTPTPTAEPTATPDPAGTMHVSAIDMSYTKKGVNYQVVTVVTIKDANGSFVSNASVSLNLTLPNGSTASGSATTGTNGQASFSYTGKATGSYTAAVTNVTHSSLTYDSSANIITSKTLQIP